MQDRLKSPRNRLNAMFRGLYLYKRLYAGNYLTPTFRVLPSLVRRMFTPR